MSKKKKYKVYIPIEPEWDYAGLYDGKDMIYQWDLDTKMVGTFILKQLEEPYLTNYVLKYPDKYLSPIFFDTIEEFKEWHLVTYFEHLI